MNTSKIPAIVMLLGGCVACVVTYINGYKLQEMLKVLILALLVFLIIGVLIKIIFDSFKFPSEEKVDDEGEVVEKQSDSSEGDETEDSESNNNSEDSFSES